MLSTDSEFRGKKNGNGRRAPKVGQKNAGCQYAMYGLCRTATQVLPLRRPSLGGRTSTVVRWADEHRDTDGPAGKGAQLALALLDSLNVKRAPAPKI